jgi:hypothetical protein
MGQTLHPELSHAHFSFDGWWQVIPQDCTKTEEARAFKLCVWIKNLLAKPNFVKPIPGSTTLDYLMLIRQHVLML